MAHRNLLLATALVAALSSHVTAAVIDFEPPTYTVGVLAAAGAATGNTFTGQGGWSTSSANAGNIVATTSSGEYVGGQAVSGGATYIGANANYLLTPHYSFDIRFGDGQEVGLGHWYDANSDNLFDQSEAQFQIGFVADGGAPYAFGARSAGFGPRLWASGTGPGYITSGAGLGGTASDWYRFDVQYAPNGSDFDLTVAARDLTTATDVDFDSNLPGIQPWTFTVTSAQFGVPLSSASGIFIRNTTTGSVALTDNINTAVPEPTGLVTLAAVAMAGLARIRRRRCS